MFPKLSDVIFEYGVNNKDHPADTYDEVTLSHILQGILVFGAIGSGKSSGAGQHIAIEFLQHNFGGLILTVKSEEVEEWKRYAQKTNRTNDLIIINEHNRLGFNFLNYELNRSSRGGGLSENIYSIFQEVSYLDGGGGGKSGGDPFWKDMAKNLFVYAVDLLKVARSNITVKDITDLVTSVPKDDDEKDDQSLLFNQVRENIESRMPASNTPFDSLTPAQKDVRIALDFFAHYFIPMADKTRSGVETAFYSLVSPFLSGLTSELLCSNTDITPEDTFDGKIIIIDLPQANFGKAGKVVQLIWKYMWQRVVEARDISNNKRPVFVYSDEAQRFITVSDRHFLNVMRGKLATTVYLTQIIGNIYGAIDNDNADALMGTFQNFIFHKNTDHKTNAWASEKIAREWQQSVSVSVQNAAEAQQGSTSVGEAYRHRLEPSEFQELLDGREENDSMVGAIFFRASDLWKETGLRYRPVFYYQNYAEELDSL